MNKSSVILNKNNEKGRDSSNSIEKNINDGTLSLQSFVNDIPFEFNQKYQTIILSNIDIEDYDTNQIRHILSKSIDFTLENQVLLEALEDLKRKKKQIQSDISNYQSSNILSVNPSEISPRDTSNLVNNVLPTSSFRLPSVRDIYWPSNYQ